MTITFCLVPFIPWGVRSEHSGFSLFLYSILKYEKKSLDMKHYSCQEDNRTIFKLPVLRGLWFKTCKIFGTRHIVHK